MKNLKILLFLSASLIGHQNNAQRTLEIITEEVGWSEGITYDDKAYFYHDGDSHFTAYDGDNLTRFTFPIRGGASLTFQPSWAGITVFENQIFLILQENSGFDINDRYLYRFNGSTFHSVPLPGKPVSNPIVYEDKLYVMVDQGSSVKLFSYAIGVLREMPSYSATSTALEPFELQIADQYLYIREPGNFSFDPARVRRFDGSDFITIPSSDHIERDMQVLAVPGTDEVYFLSSSSIVHFNGRVTRQIHRGSNLKSFSMLNSILYFQESSSSGNPDIIYGYNGSSLSQIFLPDGAHSINRSAITVFENRLFIPAALPDGSFWVYAYDGSTFQRNLEIPGIPTYGYGSVKNGKYRISISPTQIIEYDGTTSIEINAPEERSITDFVTSTSCFHLWNVFHYPEGSDGIPVVDIAKEDLECPPKAVFIIPERLREYQRIGIWLNGRYRDWCWTDIIWDWRIDPICPVPKICPDPIFGASLTDKNGEEVWGEQFKESFQLQFPFADQLPYTLTLSSINDKHQDDLFIFDDELVSQGLAEIKIYMVPKKDYFLLSADTDKSEKVSFRMSLLNKNGEEIWKEDLIAPLEKEIKGYVEKPGATLQFSTIPTENPSLKDYGITAVNIFPNPFKGKLSVEIKTKDKKIRTSLMVTDLKGNTIWKKAASAPLQQNIDLSNKKPGLYILTIAVGKAKMSEQIKLER